MSRQAAPPPGICSRSDLLRPPERAGRLNLRGAFGLGILLAAALLTGLDGAAGATCLPPDPAQCTISPWDAWEHVFVSPGTQSGVDLTTITVKDQSGNPMAGVRVEVDLSQVPGLCIDPVDPGLIGVTDGSGTVVLDPQVGGCGTGTVVIRAGGTIIRTFTEVVSTDWDGAAADGVVNNDDLNWIGHYILIAAYQQCADYTSSHSPPGAAEATIIQTAYNANDTNPNGCGGSGDPAPTSYSVQVDPWDTYGQVFVSPGTQSGADAVTFHVTDEHGYPVADIPVRVDFSACTGLCIDDGALPLQGQTDCQGNLQLDPRIGGCADCPVQVLVNGQVLRTFSRVVSPDWDGIEANGRVDGKDYAYFYSIYNSSTSEPCESFTQYGGTAGSADEALFLQAWNTDQNSVSCAGCRNPLPSDVSWYGGTQWNGALAEWEAVQGGAWTFDSGVHSDFDHSASDVDPAKNALLHGHMEGWVGVDESGGGEWSNIVEWNSGGVLDPQGCSFLSDSVLVFTDASGGHTLTQENFAASPWIHLDYSDVGRVGKVIQCDGYVELPILNYVFPRVVCQWKANGGPASAWTPLPYIPRLPQIDCSGPDGHWTFDVSQIIPLAATDVRIGLGVQNLCSSYSGCTGITNSTPWFDNVRFGVYDSPGIDSDGDGVLDAEENGGANSGDGNADGIQDASQPNVISYADIHTGRYSTVEIPGVAGAPTAAAGFGCLASRDISTYPAPPLGVTFPCGVFGVSLSWLDVRSSIQVKLTLPSGCVPTTYYKFGPTPGNPVSHWYDFSWDSVTGTGATILGNVVTLTFVDGQRGDDDLVANHQVMDAGGPALVDSCGCALSWFPNPGAPSARTGQAAAYDPSHHEMVVFGGADGGNYLDDTWVVDDGGLVGSLSPAHHPSGRVGAGMVYCTALKEIVLHGGVNAGGYLNDTWAWDGADWTQIASDGPATSDMGIANDDAIDRVILYGGAAATGRSRSTWSFDGTTWTLLNSSSPPGYRSYHKMVYSPADQLLHVFGGQVPGGTETRDNWTFDGVSTWNDLGASGPSARLHFTMAAEGGCGGIYLYGGVEGSTVYDDLWVLDGGSWQTASASGTPGQRSGGTLVYLPERQSVALVGGTDGSGSTTSSVEFLGCPARVTSVPGRPEVPAPQRVWAAPNPFWAATEISYRLEASTPVTVEVFDIAGRLLRTLVDGAPQSSGAHHLSWDARDAVGRPVATGIYFVRLRTAEGSFSRRVVRIR